MGRKADPYANMRPAKIGTVPMLVILHGKDKGKLAPGEWVRVKYHAKSPWEHVYVTKVDPDGHFFADR
jgi:hypothetical protein